MQAQADKATQTMATGPDIMGLVNTDDRYAIGALLTLHKYQEADERAGQFTAHQNGVGFNKYDAPILSDMAQFYISRGYLTEKQIAYIRRALAKYRGQIEAYGVRPVEIKPYVAPKPIEPTMEAKLQESTQKFSIYFNFPKGDSRFAEVLAKVKTLPDRRWNADARRWEVPLAIESAELLLQWGFKFSEGLAKWYAEAKGPAVEEMRDISGRIWDERLFPYQNDGVAFIESRNGRALIGDEMGLGKTAQALVWLKHHPELRPAVVICPASLKLNWAREIRMWVGEDTPITVINGKKPNGTVIGSKDIVIINYDILGDAQWDVDAKRWKLDGWCFRLASVVKALVMDEIHYAKSKTAKRTKAAQALSHFSKNVIGLSGTPIVNRPIEFFYPINMIRRDLFPSFWRFAQEYTNAKHNGYGWSFEGAKNPEKLHKTLTETIMVRRRKEDVLKDLPPKTRSVVPFEIDNRTEYEKAAADIIKWIAENEGKEKAERAKNAEFLVEFEKLKQLAVQGKMTAVVEWITDFLESGEKLIVFAVHKATVDALMDAFPGIAVKLDGSTGSGDRQAVVDRFQTDPEIRLFVGNIQAAGVGITLTAASNVAFVELPWTPGAASQAEDRAHRIGQMDNVTCWYLIAHGTVEEDIAEILDGKMKVLSAVLDGREADEGSVLMELLKKVRGN